MKRIINNNIRNQCKFYKYGSILKKPILIIKAPKGFLVCKYFDINTANKTKEAICTFSNVNSFIDILNSDTIDVSEKAKKYGIKKGMNGYDVVHKLL